MDISLIIPAYNEERYIGATIESVLKSASGKFKEIIVVDNASTDGTAAVAAGYPGVRVVREDKKGLPNARQAGLNTATTEWIAYIDADSQMTPAWFPAFERLRTRYPDAVGYTGRVTYFDSPRATQITMALLWWIFTAPAALLSGVLVGGNFVARRDALIKIGGFNTSIEFYGEDTDIYVRLSRVGRVIFTMNRLPLGTSGRRLSHDGIATTMIKYATNYISVQLLKKHIAYEHSNPRT